MNAFVICCVALMAVLFLVQWFDVRTRERANRANKTLEGKVDSLQKTMDGALVRVMRMEESMKMAKRDEAEKVESDKEAEKKHLSIESVRIALRYNGYSPDINGTNLDDWQIVNFKIEDTLFRIDTSRLPFLTLELGYRLDPEKEDVELLRRAAAEVTGGIFIAKVNIHGEGQGVVFCAEFICDNYIHLRDNLKRYLEIVIEAQRRFFDTYEKMKTEKQKVLEAAQSFKPTMGENTSKKALS
ncbi:MAG: hypothetical protein IKW89_03975 [Bacteroidales bacterium]|nr:hypothetical protein [Bacteroidales bacterium]